VNLIEIKRLYEYNSWANDRVLTALRPINQEVFASDKGASHSSIRGVVAHIAGAQWIWLERWKGSSPAALLPESDFTGQLTQADIDGSRGYRTTEGKLHSNILGDMMLHVANHSSYHRGQITTLLRQLGAVPQSTDFILFLRLQR
jgi:uncharacterized damage-inducible protein DinB